MKKKIITLALLIFIILGFILYSKYKPFSSPTELAEEFLQLLKEDKARNAYWLISKDDRKQISYDNFKNNTQWIIDDSGIPPIKTVKFLLYEIEDSRPAENFALIYIIKYYYNDAGTMINFDHFYLVLKKSNNNWKVAFKLTDKYHKVIKDIDLSLLNIFNISQSIKNLDEQNPNKENMEVNLKRLEIIKGILQKLINKYGKEHILIKDLHISNLLLQNEKYIVERKNMIKLIENSLEQIKLIDVIEKYDELKIPKFFDGGIEETIIYSLKVNRHGKAINKKQIKGSRSELLDSITKNHLNKISFKPLKIDGKQQEYILTVTYKFVISNNNNYVIIVFKLFYKIFKQSIFIILKM